MSQPTPEQVVLGHRAALNLVRERVLAFARTAWRASASYRDADVARLIALITPRVQAGQLQVAGLTSAYIATLATLRNGVLVAPAPVDRMGILDARGTPVEDVYRRPATALYTSLADGKSFGDAVAIGLGVLGVLIETDMQMANVRQARDSYIAQGVTEYVRVTSGAACKLCISASSGVYSTDHLMPIHPGCGCTTQAVSSGMKFSPKKSGQVSVRDHGEIGPMLTKPGNAFTGPSAYDASRSVEQLQTALDSLVVSAQKFSSAGTEARIAQLRAEIASRS